MTEEKRMKLYRKTVLGFSLVELLAVVLILAVLAAVAIPLYINTRRASAARACKANIASIAAAASAYALRNGRYPTSPLTTYVAASLPNTGLIGAPEGLSSNVTCPVDGSAYTIDSDGAGGAITATSAMVITCPNAAAHAAVVPAAADYTRTLPAPAAETVP
jgi:type IV pilus assembly protein PilA